MGINFAQPYFLLLMPICLAFVIFLSLKNIHGRFNQIFYSVVRSLVLILVILSLSGVSLSHYSDLSTTIFAVDISASMEGTNQHITDFLTEANRSRTESDSVGFVCFGENAVVDSLPSLENKLFDYSSYVEKGFTNISSGLKLGQSIIPGDSKKRITLISDGQENIDDALGQAKLLREQGVVLNVLTIENVLSQEVQLSELRIPKYLNKDVKYDVEVVGHSLGEGSGRLLLYKNNQLISDTDVKFHNGENNFVVDDIADKSGGVIYRAEIVPMEDTFSQNNTVYGYSYVEGAPNILVADDKGSSSEIMEILSGSKVNLTKVNTQAVPPTIEQLNIYETVILPNISVDSLPEEFPAALEAFVKNFGGGVVVTGGDNAFALGSYDDTPLEKMLPVDMELKDKSKLPNLGMVIVLDRSGSMSDGKYGVSKLELAKEAVIRSVDTLNEKDLFGVIAFDDGYEWINPVQNVGENKVGIQNSIANISVGGGTSILPGLQAAYDTIVGVDTKLKHIILLTDGQAERTGYEPLLSDMAANGITLSTVAVGADSDVNLLERLATDGNGRYYYTDEFSDLPKVFTKETFLAGKNYINNEDFYPQTAASSPVLSGIESVPVLHGYVSTTAKDRGDMILTSHKDEPVLATWQYGLGRTVAWTSDMNGIWSSDWINRAEGVDLFRNMVSWSMRKQMSSDITVTAKVIGENTQIMIAMPYSEGVEAITGQIIAPDMTGYDINFQVQSPGIYMGILSQSKAGAYIANIQIEKLGGIENVNTGIGIPYSAEYDIRNFEKGKSLLKKLAEITGGKVITDPKEIFEPIERRAYGEVDISNLLLALSLLLFVLDVAVRRFPALARSLESVCNRFREVFKWEAKKSEFKLNSKQGTIKEKEKEKEKKRESKRIPGLKKAKRTNLELTEKAGEKKATVFTSSALVSQKKKRGGK